mmetsp:Transcript_11649/g.14468  ORF Transcript_11649/g.14468 Transcript_11649/m.14468 type:complete len:81 (-) Transcript_11649:1722-1964(-)
MSLPIIKNMQVTNYVINPSQKYSCLTSSGSSSTKTTQPLLHQHQHLARTTTYSSEISFWFLAQSVFLPSSLLDYHFVPSL